jgi:N-acetylmuramoyl-L-alanine amidase
MRAMPVQRRTLLASGLIASLSGTSLLRPTAAEAARRRTHHPARHPVHRPKVAAPKSPVIVLDPGHGGKDPGSIGVSGTYEKTITLATAQAVARQLQAARKYRVLMTRSHDVFIPLAERVAYAQRNRAALFISLHANSTHSHHAHGASVYTLANRASDALSAATARQENAADRFAGPRFRHVSPDVARILNSLVREETRLGSARLQAEIVQALSHAIHLLDPPERHAHFVVLKAANIPSVLVEMGFMSNRAEEKLLRSAHHRLLIARAMRHAVDAWFEKAGQFGQVVG